MRQAFEDHFSENAQDYARYRPCYSAPLFDYLAAIAPARRLAWDCGTGNGQAAVELARHFDHVVGTDASAEQLAAAFRHDRIEYRLEPAEETSLQSGSVDLVTAAVAVHWFDFDAFYRQVHRVLRPAGVIAVWTYFEPVIDGVIEGVVMRYYGQVLKGYWPERVRYIEEGYSSLPFPFRELEPPPFEMEAEWDLGELLGFLGSWSATRNYTKAQGTNPLKLVWPELAGAWGNASTKKKICWPLHLRVGRSDASSEVKG